MENLKKLRLQNYYVVSKYWDIAVTVLKNKEKKIRIYKSMFELHIIERQLLPMKTISSVLSIGSKRKIFSVSSVSSLDSP